VTGSHLRYLALGLIVLLLVGMRWLGTNLEGFINRVDEVPLPQVSEAARSLHDESVVVDLHADSTLSGRNLLERSDVGHVDLPRLREGGVALQLFTVVTRVPLGMNVDATDGDRPDLLTLMGLLQGSPFLNRGPYGRTVLQADRLKTLIAGSGGLLVLVRSRRELDELLARRGRGEEVIGALLGIEGAHALEGDPANLDRVFRAGFRMIGLTHFFDNHYAGSAHGLEKGGLTEAGRELVRRMGELGILLDLAHLSPTAIDEVLRLVPGPVLVSHTGVKGTCDNLRNLSDRHVREIAARGGVIGIGFWDTAVCGIEPRHVVAAMQHVIALVGDDHVALGSDYDGGTTVAFDISGLRVLTQAMLDAGLEPESVRKVLGGNVIRALREGLPD
jgi:membrane dipeptidase